MPGEGLYLAGEREPLHLGGEIWAELLPLLDGQRTIEQVLAALPGRVPEAFAALDRLRARGQLVDGPPHTEARERPSAAFWEALGADSARAPRAAAAGDGLDRGARRPRRGAMAPRLA